MFILLNIKHFYMVELEHLPIAHFLLFYLHASRLTVNTEGPWWWPGGMGMEVNATRRKPKTSCWCSKSISQHHLLLSIVYCRNMANTSAINKEGAEGKISDGIQKRRIQSTDSHYCQSYCIALHMGTWQEKNYKNSPLASEKRYVIWTVLGTRKRTAKVRDHMLGNCKLYFLCWRGDASLFYFLLWIETR